MGVQAVSFVDGDPQRLCSGASQVHMGVDACIFFGTHIKSYYITSHYITNSRSRRFYRHLLWLQGKGNTGTACDMPEYNGQVEKLGLVETLECEAAEPMPKSHPLMTLRGAAAEDDVDIIGGFVSFAKCVCHCLLS